MVRFNGKFKVTTVTWTTSPGPSTWMVPPWLLDAGGGEQIHILSRELKKTLWKALWTYAAHVYNGCHYSPGEDSLYPWESNPWKPAREALLWSVLVSCSHCMQTWQMSVECDHAQKRYLQTWTTSNSHCLIASLDARSTSSSLYERINKEALTLFPKEKATTGEHMQMPSWEAGYVLHDRMGDEVRPRVFPNWEIPSPLPRFFFFSFPQTCHFPHKLNLKGKASFVKLLWALGPSCGHIKRFCSYRIDVGFYGLTM